MKFSKLLLCACFFLSVAAAAQHNEAPVLSHEKNSDATLIIESRPIFTFRSTVLGIEAVERKKRGQERIEKQLSVEGTHHATMTPLPPGMLISINNAGSFYIAPSDIDPFQQETLEGVAKNTVDVLNVAIQETHESRSLDFMLRATANALSATVIFLLLLWLLYRIRRFAENRIAVFTKRTVNQLGENNAQIVNWERIQWILNQVVRAFSWIIVLVMGYEWLSICMRQFPLTRPYSPNLDDYFIGLMDKIGTAVLNAIPDLFTALIIVLLARSATHGFSRLFERIQHERIQLGWFHADLASPTRRIINIAIWVFALAMAYPYLPGANTEAFKGVSVLVGLMISIGASGLVGQIVSGLILTYTGIYRKGDYISLMDYCGSISELGMFTTRICDNSGCELTIPNSLVLHNVTRNYSKPKRSDNLTITTKVAVGYETPWRQAHEMLTLAVKRTPGLLQAADPQLYQTKLAEFYYEYELRCTVDPDQPLSCRAIRHLLHTHILDVFNEYGVQLMVPAYADDPSTRKVVPKSEWYKAPANLGGSID